MDTVKYQFFSEKNNQFIIELLKKKGSCLLNKNTVFQIQNNIFNTFLESVYNKDIAVTNSNIEEILVSLNKMTLIQCEKNAAAPAPAQPSPPSPPSVPSVSSPPVPSVSSPPVPSVSFRNEGTQTQARTLLKNTQVQCEPTKTTDSLFHYFSDDNSLVKFRDVTLKTFGLHFNLYNINEHNNSFEIKIDTITTKIYIPIGHYDLKNLLSTIENSISSKISLNNFKVLHDPLRNRIKIHNTTHFNLHFIDSPKAILNLRTLLGFHNTDYMNNNYYTTENEHKLDLFNIIYVRSNQIEPNILTSSGFDYLFKLDFDSSKHGYINFDFDCHLLLKEHKIAFEFYIYVKEFKQISHPIDFDAIFSV